MTTRIASPRPPGWRRLPVGAELAPGGGAHLRVWAPGRRRVAAVLEEGGEVPLDAEADGYWSGTIADARAGTRYRIRLDDEAPLPDPASRWQPDGPHGASAIVDPGAFAWSDDGWRGRAIAGQVIMEIHIGTFTREGSWRAAIAKLPLLAEVGVTVLEVMPVAEFPGRFGWGYDGVQPFAPTRLYGTPDDMRAFVDAAHGLGLAVLLDVVYNHLGPDGNYLPRFAPAYFSTRHRTDWGEAPNFDGPDSAPVREYFVSNARYWVTEFHLDGLRVDATQNIYDDSERHILAEVCAAVRDAANGRATIVVGENEPQETRMLRPASAGGCALDALWNDDWHHSAMVALTTRDEAYYTDYRGRPQEFVSAAKYGFLYQGQWYRWQRKRRGTPARDIAPARFVHFLQNHDQIANSGLGERCHRLASPGKWRALTALLLLGPQTPMLFMGQEFAASAPFLYFADHEPALAEKVEGGRRRELAQFPSLALPEMAARLAVPHDPATFARCKLDWAERERHAEVLAMHRDLLRIRREDPVIGAQSREGLDGAVLDRDVFILRWFADDGADRLLVVNLGTAVHLDPAPEPLLAPPTGARWRAAWSSEDPEYGGLGTPALDAAEEERALATRPDVPRPRENWRIPGEAAVLLVPHPHAA